MNWKNVYLRIISNAKVRNNSHDEYYERHHIVPKSIFNFNIELQILKLNINNINSKENLVLLTAREHFFCHVLLTKIFENDKNCYEKMLYAFNFMSNRFGDNSKKYSILKEKFAKNMRENMIGKRSRAFGCIWSAESKLRQSIKRKGRSYEELYGYEKAKELKSIRSENRKGRKNSVETCKKLSERVISKDWRDKISLARLGSISSLETKEKLSNYFSNSLLNPKVDQNFYQFKNIILNKVIIARPIDMKRLYQSNVSTLITGKRKTVNNWELERRVYLRFGQNIKMIEKHISVQGVIYDF